MKKYLNGIFNILISIVYFFYSKIVIFSIYISEFKKLNYLYTDHFGFGDFVVYCVSMRNKLNNKKKIFCFSRLQNEIAEFFFDKKYISTSFMLMPRFMNESYLGYNFLMKEKIFKPTNPPIRKRPGGNKVPTHYWFPRTKSSIQFIKNSINFLKVSKSIIKIFKKPTLCLFIKNFSNKINNHINFQVRQTRNLNKIFRLIYFLNKKKNINVIILGRNDDHFIKFLPKKIKEKKLKNIFLFKNLSKNYSINDQAYTAYKSIGYVGSSTGANIFCLALNKKIILIDSPLWYADKFWANVNFLYKKIYNKKNKIVQKFVWQKYYNPTKYKIIETNYKQIKDAVLNKILS